MQLKGSGWNCKIVRGTLALGPGYYRIGLDIFIGYTSLSDFRSSLNDYATPRMKSQKKGGQRSEQRWILGVVGDQLLVTTLNVSQIMFLLIHNLSQEQLARWCLMCPPYDHNCSTLSAKTKKAVERNMLTTFWNHTPIHIPYPLVN